MLSQNTMVRKTNIEKMRTISRNNYYFLRIHKNKILQKILLKKANVKGNKRNRLKVVSKILCDMNFSILYSVTNLTFSSNLVFICKYVKFLVLIKILLFCIKNIITCFWKLKN